jgi:SAM-dependent methyltransferase
VDDNRLVFDSISEQFDKWREHYSQELFDYIIKTCELNATKRCLEIGPGTGQASDFAIHTGCDYTAIELGANLAKIMQKKYGGFGNFKLVVDDFEKHFFVPESYDLIYSAATIQWIKEEVAYSKCFEMLKNRGYLAMFRMHDDYKTPNPELYEEIQHEYDVHYAVNVPYTCKFNYENGSTYGFVYLGRSNFHGQRVYTADEYVEFVKTNADLITIKEEMREPFFDGIHDAIMRHGNKIVIQSVYVLDLYQKP